MLFSIIVIASLFRFVLSWEFLDIDIPIVKNEKFQINLFAVDDAIKKLSDRRIIWVLGKFKVGKTFLVDHMKGEGHNSNAIINTIGLKAWYDDDYVVIDTEGIFQPIGANNVFFVKEFLTALMARTADSLVFVSDQMDVVDMELYKFYRGIFWYSLIDSMYYIHNCKSLLPDQLKTYQGRITNLLKLNKRSVDETQKGKPVQHLFIPKLDEINSLGAIISSFFGRKVELNFLGSSVNQNNVFNTYSFVDAISDALVAIGSQPLEKFESEPTTLYSNGFNEQDLPVLPSSFRWCTLPQQKTADSAV
jgi:hypothetical protein